MLAANAPAAGLPAGATIMVLTQDGWELHAAVEGRLRQIATATEARAPIMHVAAGVLAYVGADAALHEIDLSSMTDTVLLRPDAGTTFAQPAYDSAADGLYLVAFKDGSSADTDIVYFDRRRRAQRPVVRQRSSQFEPHPTVDGRLLYSSVACTIGCGKIIQEIWRIDPNSENADQLTLLNSISRQAVADDTGFYFSSNSAGHFHIWRQEFAADRAVQLTSGLVTDVSPALDGKRRLYLIRHSPQGSRVMVLSDDGEPRAVSLPENFRDLRDLRIDPFAAKR